MTRHILLFSALFILFVGCRPEISSIEPYAARENETVLIRGEHLSDGPDNPTQVLFNGTLATGVTLVPDGLAVVVPAGAGSGPVRVTCDYVSMSSPGGTAESPAEFTVITRATTESEGNDSMSLADRVNLNEIRGEVSSLTDVDWFEVPTGPAGVYGYTLEFNAEAIDLPDGVELRVQLVDAAGNTQNNLYVGGLPEDEVTTCWSAQRPNTHLYLEVTWGGSMSGPVWTPFDYRITFARIPINDTNEPDNDETMARPISLGDPHNGSYFGVVEDLDHGYHVDDWYELNLAEPITLVITIQKAGLSPEYDDAVKVWVYGPDGTPVIEDMQGTAESFSHAVPVGEGRYLILVSHTYMDMYPYGTGYAPLAFKRPYLLTVSSGD